MFGLSFGELCVLLLVAVVVLGPKELPRYLRKAGQFAGRLRRMAYEMREKSGIDEVLRTEGIDRDIAEIRRLARGELGSVASAVRSTADAMRIPGITAPASSAPGRPPERSPAAGTIAAQPNATRPAPAQPGPAMVPEVAVTPPGAVAPPRVDRDREYPREGADSYGALPEMAPVYDGDFPASALADDPLYARGEDPGGPGAAPSSEDTPASAASAATGTSG